ncbi:PIG-L family deacetylase [Microbacterium sp. 18062]|uniref:PIG-L family deacetylase n=1 Tax=Microbacterium sp. 18062 TaxID=2681410 RepID=UPI001357538E|nr:PIG-L family deacetylase [Microbacterium sp. 18062]
MSVAFDHRDVGTEETRWREAAPWREAPPLDLTIDRLIVLAAHPDDEALGAGGLIAWAAASGIDVTIVLVTDGEASHPGHPDPTALAGIRRAEFLAAVTALTPRAALVLLGVDDGGVEQARAAVTEAVAAIVRRGRAERTLVATTWWGDGHRDHRVLGEIALALRGGGVSVVGYPIWMWHWADPAGVDTSTWRTLPLGAEASGAKRRAVAAYRSQLEADPGRPEDGAMLHANTLAHFARDVEVFVLPDAGRPDAAPADTAPSDAETSAAPRTAADFDAFHARHEDPWGLESRWYERRKRALLLAALPREVFRRALELGCASGATTRVLAERAASVVAVDASEVALRRARDRGVPGGAVFERHELPEDWPHGTFDLVVLSELGYYWTPGKLALALERIDGSASADAVLVLCHWRHPIEGAPQTGDDVHSAVSTRRDWRMLSRHVEEDFLLDVLVRPDAPSVAEEEGLTEPSRRVPAHGSPNRESPASAPGRGAKLRDEGTRNLLGSDASSRPLSDRTLSVPGTPREDTGARARGVVGQGVLT